MEAKNDQLLWELYPFAMELNVPMPSAWNGKDKHVYIKLSHESRRAQYKGPGKNHKDAAAIRANNSIPPICGLYYFEILVVSKGRDGYIGVGLSESGVGLNRLPGWEKRSYGYHGDDGNSFLCCGTGVPYGPTYTTGDVIGCGVNFEDRTCFYTKNGQNLGTVFRDLPLTLYPVVGMQTPGEVVEVNFGHMPFVYNIKRDIEEARSRTWHNLHSIPLSDSKTDWMRSLVAAYLVHQGYPQTASAFTKFSGGTLKESLESISCRRNIRLCIIEGHLSRAVALLNNFYSALLANDLQLKFVLMCALYAEMFTINSSERRLLMEDDFPESLFPMNDTPDDSSPMSSNQFDEGLSSGECADLNSPVCLVPAGQSPSMEIDASPTGSNNATLTVDSSDNISPRNGSEIQKYGNGISKVGVCSEMANEENDESDMEEEEEPRSAMSNGRCCSEFTPAEMAKLVSFGRFITQLAKRLEVNDLMLPELAGIMMDTFALVAYEEPDRSPFCYLLDQQRRVSLSVIVNSAILNWNGDAKLSELERMFKYASHLRKLLKDASLASTAFLDPQEFLIGNR